MAQATCGTAKIRLYPFTQMNVKYSNSPWFFDWHQANKDRICEEHGTQKFVGGSHGYEKTFSYYEVDARFLSATKIELSFYRSENLLRGGRGDKILVLNIEVPASDVKDVIEQRMKSIATVEYERREVERLRIAREQGIAAVYQELFGEVL